MQTFKNLVKMAKNDFLLQAFIMDSVQKAADRMITLPPKEGVKMFEKNIVTFDVWLAAARKARYGEE
jgi:hypothetical protein